MNPRAAPALSTRIEQEEGRSLSAAKIFEITAFSFLRNAPFMQHESYVCRSPPTHNRMPDARQF